MHRISSGLTSAGMLHFAEAKQTVVAVPVILEGAEAEPEVATREAVHVRHPVVAIGVGPECILLIERYSPFTDRKLIWHLCLQQRHALPADQDCILLRKEAHAIFTRYRCQYREDFYLVGFAGFQLVRCLRKVRAGHILVEVAGGWELFCLLCEGVQLAVVVVVGRNRKCKFLDCGTETFVIN